jgi:hypothetical protein
MVAYGVLDARLPNPREFIGQGDAAVLYGKYEQIRRMVHDELKAHGLLMLATKATIQNAGYRKDGKPYPIYALYGCTAGVGFRTRPVLASGTFQECCVAAADYLDKAAVLEGFPPTPIE